MPAELEQFDPALILGCSLDEVPGLMRGRPVTPGEVEGVALRTYRWRASRHDPRSYWVTVGQAAEILHRPRTELEWLIAHHRIAYCTHADGVRLIRRHQLEQLRRRATAAAS